ncbi:MAG: hypothetical protein IJK18_04745 [Clostridia bacterium]|nr:hypothetical protein [Clostridia bacterium]
MTKKKEKLLDKFVKKDYNNDLEEVLAKKSFPEEVKNLLQDSLYKTENAYKDYEIVKKNVISIEEYIQNIINAVKTSCDQIELIRPEFGQKENYIIDKENKKIVCFPNPKQLLYAVNKIQKFEDIIRVEPDFLKLSLTNMINFGNVINAVEPIRDFNGFAWSVSASDIENFYYNLIYQDLIILGNNKLIDEWVNKNDEMVDYLELFNEELEKKYGKKYQNEILELLKIISVLLEMNRNKTYKKELTKKKKEVEKELEAMQDKVKYLEEISNLKKKIEKNIKKIDLTLNNKEKLTKEYEKRNKDLPLEEKIFSKNVLKKILANEREKYLLELRKCNNKINSKNFSKYKKEYEYEAQYLKLVGIKDIEKEIFESIMFLQKRVLQAIKFKIKNATNRDEITKIIYEIRYFNLIPIDEKTKICDISKLKRMIIATQSAATLKAYELKDFKDIFKDKSKNINILKYMFNLKIIKLEDAAFKLIKEDDSIFVQFYDDNVLDEKFKIDTEIESRELKIRFNKKVKVFDL